MEIRTEPLERDVFEAHGLIEEFPPIWRHPNKRVVYEIACPPGCAFAGEIRYSRWGPMTLPETIDSGGASRLLDVREDHYDYAPEAGDLGAVEWHVNFADPHLFVAYGSALMAQDEMQVAEHRALGALREALTAKRHRAVTVDNGDPTPVLVMGVERRCRVATDPNAAEGRPEGLYGNAFAHASEEAVRRATHRIDPPTITNILTMSAPPGGNGRYRREEIEWILVTAFTGFRAAVLESTGRAAGMAPVVIHSGFWGCGASGGHRVLMATLQILAAAMAGIHRLLFHAFDAAGTRALQEARTLIQDELGGDRAIATADLIARLHEKGFEWGVSDGN